MFGKLVAHQPPPSYCQTVQYMVMVERELTICLLCVSFFLLVLNNYLCTGASLYAPCSLLLISNKFWMGRGVGGEGGELEGEKKRGGCSVADPDLNPDPYPYVFGPPGSGSGSFRHQAKKVRKNLDSYCFVTSF
jgi:hypothetical protein